jgi:hypothetical protein
VIRSALAAAPLSFAIALSAAAVGCNDRAKEVDPAVQQFVDELNAKAEQRVNGVRLTISARLVDPDPRAAKPPSKLTPRIGSHDVIVVPDPKAIKERSILVQWTLDYDGPRPPLIILRPEFPSDSLGCTYFSVFIPGLAEKPVAVRLEQDRGAEMFLGFPKERFISAQEGQTCSDSIVLPISRVKAALEKASPQFDKDNPPDQLYLQLHHNPRLRTNLRAPQPDGLDAWTGDLSSNVVRIKLSKW